MTNGTGPKMCVWRLGASTRANGWPSLGLQPGCISPMKDLGGASVAGSKRSRAEVMFTVTRTSRARKTRCPSTTTCNVNTSSVMTSDSLDGKIAQLSRSRAVLALLIAKIDRELIPLKTKRNAVSPLYRMPAEVLIEIFKLVQLNNCASNGWFSRLDSPSRDWKRIVPEHEWTRILAVSSHIRAVAVAAPELWAYFCSSWPTKWREVYIQRRGDYPLRFAYHVTTNDRASRTRGLLNVPRYAASHAVLDFDETGEAPGWSGDYLAVLRAQSNSLQFLTIQAHRGRMSELTLWPGLLSGFGQLSHLNVDLARGVRVDDAFSFPSTLRALRLTQVIIPCTTNRVRALLEGLPCLEYLEISSFTKAPTPDTAPSDPSMKVSPINLSLHTLLIKDCHYELLHAILQLVPVPCRVLHIDCAVRLWRSLASNTQYIIAHCIRDYCQRFWSARMGNNTLPPATLHVLSGDPPHGKSWIETHHCDRWDELCAFRLVLPCHPVAADDILLPYVTDVHLNKRGSATTRTEDTWSTFCDLPALQTIHINCFRAWETVEDVKRWADAHSCRPITVHFSSHIARGDHDLQLIWQSSEEPLKETAWSTYIAAEHALRQLPDSDNEEGS
jgi:hypothetical protein